MAAMATKQPAAVHTCLNARKYMSRSASFPALITREFALGMLCSAVSFHAVSAGMNLSRSSMDNTMGTVAWAILSRRRPIASLKRALSTSEVSNTVARRGQFVTMSSIIECHRAYIQIARPMVPPRERVLMTRPLATAMSSGGVDSWAAVTRVVKVIPIAVPRRTG
jgi:hypothetical protein